MKKIFFILCIVEIFYVIDLSLSEGLQNTVICVIFETGATSAFCKNFFEENNFVLSEVMIYRSVFLPLLLVIAGIFGGGYLYYKQQYKRAVKLNASLFAVAFILFSLIVLGF